MKAERKREMSTLFALNVVLLFVASAAVAALDDSSCPCRVAVVEHVDVVVIGAGVSGIAAAWTIERNRTSADSLSYVVLEAQNRVGGALRSTELPLGGITVEDGPSWIGGDGDNPIYALATEFGLEIFPHDYENAISYDASGRFIPDRRFRTTQKRYDNTVYDCLKEAADAMYDEWKETGKHPRNINVEDQQAKCGWVSENGMQDVVSFLNHDLDWQASPDMVSLAAYPDPTFEDFVDGRGEYNEYLVVDREGYAKIPREIVRTKLRQEPLLNREVCRVEYTNDKRGKGGTAASVYALDKRANNACTKYETKRVISTISPNLYRWRPALFEPAIDASRLPLFPGDYQRIYYQFPTAFWDSKQFINVVLEPGRRGECGWFQNLDYGSRQDDGAPHGGPPPSNVQDAIWPGSKTLMCLIVTGAIEKVGDGTGVVDEAVARTFLEPLKNIYGDDYVEPSNIYIPDLRSDPYNGVVYWKEGFGFDDWSAFFEQGQPAVHISGSESCLSYAGWTHGAYYAGVRSANRVLHELGEIADPGVSVCDEPLPGILACDACLERMENIVANSDNDVGRCRAKCVNNIANNFQNISPFRCDTMCDEANPPGGRTRAQRARAACRVIDKCSS